MCQRNENEEMPYVFKNRNGIGDTNSQISAIINHYNSFYNSILKSL